MYKGEKIIHRAQQYIWNIIYQFDADDIFMYWQKEEWNAWGGLWIPNQLMLIHHCDAENRVQMLVEKG